MSQIKDIQTSETGKIQLQIEANINYDHISNNLNKLKVELIKTYLLLNLSKKSIPLKKFMNFFEKDLIDTTLSMTNGNQKKASTVLGLKTSTLCEKIRKYEIKKELPADSINPMAISSFQDITSMFLMETK